MDGVPVETFGLRVDQEICFTAHNNKPHKGTRERQLKLLKGSAPTLKQVLKPDEEVWLVVRAVSPMSWFEQLTTGWMIYYLKRCVLVFTNQRILHLPTTMNFKSKLSIAQVYYGDIAVAKLSGFLGRALKLTYRTGKQETFNYIEPADFRKLKTLLPSLPKEAHSSEASERHYLCPRCLARLLKGIFTCSNCQLQFKDGERAVRLSVLYPGGGYFYTRHPILGAGDAIVEGLLLILLFGGLIDAWAGEKGPEAWILVAIMAGALAMEKAQTIYHTIHYVNEYIPLEKNFAPLTAPA
jgi:hypothetical protein